jgi:predicted DNA-binding protein (UPF0251 family)
MFIIFRGGTTTMPRPCRYRRIAGEPAAPLFKPAGIPAVDLEILTLTLDEFEAIRLADQEGLYQEPAALRMGVSRPTFSRIVESARRKVAEALVGGKGIRIEGGPVLSLGQRKRSGGKKRRCRSSEPVSRKERPS